MSSPRSNLERMFRESYDGYDTWLIRMFDPDTQWTGREYANSEKFLSIGAYKALGDPRIYKMANPSQPDLLSFEQLVYFYLRRPELGTGMMREILAAPPKPHGYTTEEDLIIAPFPPEEMIWRAPAAPPSLLRWCVEPDSGRQRALWHWAHGDLSMASYIAKVQVDGVVRKNGRSKSDFTYALNMTRLISRYAPPRSEKSPGKWAALGCVSRDPDPQAYLAGLKAASSLEDVRQITAFLGRGPTAEEVAACPKSIRICRWLPWELLEPIKDDPVLRASLLRGGIASVSPEDMRDALTNEKTRPLWRPLDAKRTTTLWTNKQALLYDQRAFMEPLWECLVGASFGAWEKVLIGNTMLRPDKPALRVMLDAFPSARNFAEDALIEMNGRTPTR